MVGLGPSDATRVALDDSSRLWHSLARAAGLE